MRRAIRAGVDTGILSALDQHQEDLMAEEVQMTLGGFSPLVPYQDDVVNGQSGQSTRLQT